MAEIDVSSYPKPTAGPSALDTIGKIQGLESQRLGIDKQKMELMNKGFEYLIREVNSIDPATATPEDFFRIGQNAVNQGFLKPEQFSQFVKTVPADKAAIPQFKQEFLRRAMTTQEMINWDYGQRTSPADTGQTSQEQVFSPKPGFGGTPGRGGVLPVAAPIQKQVPPTAQTTDTREILPDGSPNPAFGQQSYVGPQAPQLAPNTAAGPAPLKAPIPVAPPTFDKFLGGNPMSGVNQTPAQVVADRFPQMPRGMPVGQAPGVAEAASTAGQSSGVQLAKARDRASNFQREIFPLNEAISALEKLGTKGTGPGTETINHLKSFVLSNVPGVKESDFNGTIADYDKAKKYLTDFVNQNGNTGTNDKLAAAFAGNPSVGISNAAAVDVAKAAKALSRMQQATLLEFEKSGKRPDQFSQWVAKRNNELDPRAFGVDMMKPEAKARLRQQLDRNPVEAKRFEKSLQIAQEYFNK